MTTKSVTILGTTTFIIIIMIVKSTPTITRNGFTRTVKLYMLASCSHPIVIIASLKLTLKSEDQASTPCSGKTVKFTWFANITVTNLISTTTKSKTTARNKFNGIPFVAMQMAERQ